MRNSRMQESKKGGSVMIKLTFGERLKDARTVHNRNGKQTLKEVEEATDVRRTLISDLENDKNRGTDYRDINKLAKHYGVSLDWLIDGGVHPVSREPDVHTACETTGLSETAVTMLQRLNRLSPTQEGTPHIPSILSECLESAGFLELLVASKEYAVVRADVPANAELLSYLETKQKYKCVEDIDIGLREATEGLFMVATTYDIAEANHAKAIGGLELMLVDMVKKRQKENCEK